MPIIIAVIMVRFRHLMQIAVQIQVLLGICLMLVAIVTIICSTQITIVIIKELISKITMQFMTMG